MNKLFNTIVLACAATLSLSAMASPDDGNFLAQRHMKKGIQCAQCHSNNDVNKPVRKAECLTCTRVMKHWQSERARWNQILITTIMATEIVPLATKDTSYLRSPATLVISFH